MMFTSAHIHTLFLIFINIDYFCTCRELSPKTIELKNLRLKEWESQRSIYETLFLHKTYADFYRTNKIALNPKRCGIRGTSAIVNDKNKLIMCTIPKVGSSTWRNFMLYLDFPELSSESGKLEYTRKYGVAAPDAHNISKNGVKLIALQTPARALEYYNDATYLKVFHVRNPITRLLSAWLSKNAQSSNPLPFAMKFATFAAFVEDLVRSKTDLSKADGHIRFQRTFCDFDRGSHFDIYLKFENRQHWGGLLLRHLHLENDPVFQQFIKTSQIPFMGADTVEVLLQHYTPSVFDKVRELYKEDIKAFEYERDVELLGEIIRSTVV